MSTRCCLPWGLRIIRFRVIQELALKSLCGSRPRSTTMDQPKAISQLYPEAGLSVPRRAYRGTSLII